MGKSIIELNKFCKTNKKSIMVRNGKLAGYMADTYEWYGL